MFRRIYKRIHPLTCLIGNQRDHSKSRCQEDRNSQLNITTRQHLDNHLKVQHHQEFTRKAETDDVAIKRVIKQPKGKQIVMRI